jgi:glycosyltransferase involved in cell wall biosynthesis
MHSPKVSILLPNLNTRPYLEERMRTIQEQTIRDWELIIVDSHSDDGAWEYFQVCAKHDPRINISQAPDHGIYANWNDCINLAKGEYVYIATSDDTMSADFLEVMVNALDDNPGCDLAHCKLKIIDKNGCSHPQISWDTFLAALYFGESINKRHIRIAPHDGLLHCGIGTVYTSITQLLIRRSLFAKTGLFLTEYGSTADFEWGMRASLIADTIHVPGRLATWRVHGSQKTDRKFLKSAAHMTQLIEMIDHAVEKAKKIKPDLLKKIKTKELKYLYTKEKFRAEMLEQKKSLHRCKVAFKWLFKSPKIITELFLSLLIKSKLFISKSEPLEFSRKILKKYGVENNIKDQIKK